VSGDVLRDRIATAIEVAKPRLAPVEVMRLADAVLAAIGQPVQVAERVRWSDDAEWLLCNLDAEIIGRPPVRESLYIFTNKEPS
jgi:hypothetical protein